VEDPFNPAYKPPPKQASEPNDHWTPVAPAPTQPEPVLDERWAPVNPEQTEPVLEERWVPVDPASRRPAPQSEYRPQPARAEYERPAYEPAARRPISEAEYIYNQQAAFRQDVHRPVSGTRSYRLAGNQVGDGVEMSLNVVREKSARPAMSSGAGPYRGAGVGVGFSWRF
jgi:hypothetical protein